MNDIKFTNEIYLGLLKAFGNFSQAACNELNDLMYYVERTSERCGMESIHELRYYFENNQIEGLPSSQERFINIASTEEEKELARNLEFHLETYISSMRVGNKHFSLISWQVPIKISTNDYYEIINKIQMTDGNVHEAAGRYLDTLHGEPAVFIAPMETLMNDCLEPIDRYLQIVLNLAKNALYKYVFGVSGCINAAKEYKMDRFGEQESQRVRWRINGERL